MHLPLVIIALLGCPKPAAAIDPELATSDARAQDYAELASALAARTGPHDAAAAELARALAQGGADDTVHAAAHDLLASMAAAPEPADDPVADPVSETPAPRDPVRQPTPEGVAADERAVALIADDRIAEARQALRYGDYELAIAALSPLRGSASWRDAEPFYAEAVDGFVGAERERVGKLYVNARKLTGDARRTALLQVRELLAGLVEAYPGSVYYEPLLNNLERVERELD